MSNFIQTIVILLFIYINAACTNRNANDNSPISTTAQIAAEQPTVTLSPPFIVTEKTESGIYFIHAGIPLDSQEMPLQGTITLADNCLRLVSTDIEDSYLLILPHNVKLVENNNLIEMVDLNGNILMAVGDDVALGGTHIRAPDELTAILPPECAPPYFVVGADISER